MLFLSFCEIPSDRIKISKELLIWMIFIWSAAVMKMMTSMIPNPLEQPTKPTKYSRFYTSRMAFRQHPRHDNIMDCSGNSRFDRPSKQHPSLDQYVDQYLHCAVSEGVPEHVARPQLAGSRRIMMSLVKRSQERNLVRCPMPKEYEKIIQYNAREHLPNQVQ